MEPLEKVLLHVGCANRVYKGFINSDKKDWGVQGSSIMDISQPWPYEDESIDGIGSMHVMQQLTWRELVFAFMEAFRVLKKGGVMRMGCPMVEIEDRSLDYILGWKNINLFSFDILKKVLVDRMGFSSIENCKFRQSAIPELGKLDNRYKRGTHYIEVVK